MPRSDRIYAVVWTWREGKIVPTKKAGRDEMRAWKERYEAQGWGVRASGPDAYIARAPESENGIVRDAHAIVFHEYDAATKERIFDPPKSRKPVKRPATPKPRRGRKPIGV